MTSTDDQYVERARQVGLFRYGLIREAADPALSTRQRGRLVGEIAAGEHVGPFGAPVRVSRPTVDRGSGSGGPVVSTPSSRPHAGSLPALPPRCWRWRSRSNGRRRRGPPPRSRAVLLASSGWAPHERTGT